MSSQRVPWRLGGSRGPQNRSSSRRSHRTSASQHAPHWRARRSRRALSSIRTTSQTACNIGFVGKARNGSPRWWCTSHGANATGPRGLRLDVCLRAETREANANILRLDPADYPGGVAIWRVSRPVYDTTHRQTHPGVHVHARLNPDAPKNVDASYDAVDLQLHGDLVHANLVVTESMARAYYLARFCRNRLKSLSCTHCGAPHLDEGWFSIKPHRRHLCAACGHHFVDQDHSVSNPLVGVEEVHAANGPHRAVRARRTLAIDQREYPAGIQLWASNPALLWTAQKPEEEGIHAHLYGSQGDLREDDTFNAISIDGVALDERMIKQLMAQQAVETAVDKVVSLRCPECQGSHFDAGLNAFTPHSAHTCEHCGKLFRAGRHAVISNPIVEVLRALRANVDAAPGS